MKFKFGFIGCGNMGGALAQAVAKSTDPTEIVLCDANIEKAAALAESLGCGVALLEQVAADCEYIFLGVKPQGFEGLFAEIAPTLKARKDRFVLISMAAGVSVAAVEKMCGKKAPVIRIMPNTPVSVGEGMILYTANEAVTEKEIDTFLRALAKAGKITPSTPQKVVRDLLVKEGLRKDSAKVVAKGTDSIVDDIAMVEKALKVVLASLEKKGKVRISGTRNLHYYEPLVPREPIAQKETADMIERVYDGSVSDMLAAMAKSGAIPKEEIPKLREILDSCESEIK